MTVALSGDGADEVFSGYNKHSAWLRANANSPFNSILRSFGALTYLLPKSRSNVIGNRFRQLNRFYKMLKMSDADRYWFMATFQQMTQVNKLLNHRGEAINEYNDVKERYLSHLEGGSFNHFLRADCELVLPNDMLTKVDLMSMANSLEVRVPYLDHEVVEFAFSLPADYKINKSIRKRVLQEAFKDILPPELYNRPKKGFEVPMLNWLRNHLKADVDKTLFNASKISDQGIFESKEIMKLRRKLHSFSPGDSHAKVWALFVFQKWYEKYM